MTRFLTGIQAVGLLRARPKRRLPAVCCMFLLTAAAPAGSAQHPQQAGLQRGRATPACRVLADQRLHEPLRAIIEEYGRRSGSQVALSFLTAPEVNARIQNGKPECDVVLSMPVTADGRTAVRELPGARKVAWKYPSGEPVWAAALGEHPEAARLLGFVGGPTGHRLWSESEAGFTITSGRTRAEAFQWVVEHRTAHTYPITARRMLRECGGIRSGVCIDVGCGTGRLDVELLRRADFENAATAAGSPSAGHASDRGRRKGSDLTIIGLDIDPDMKPLFEKTIREAGFQDRASFVLGDAQEMPFPDDYADMIVSRGTLIFIPDIGKCLREVDRVLKPTGVAFLGGRYVYTPRQHKISTDKLRTIVRQANIPGARVVEGRGQWVKIVGPEAPESARQFQGGPQMLAGRFVADYDVTAGKCLLICRGDGHLERSLQQGFVELTRLEMTALYPSETVAEQAAKRIHTAGLGARITCQTGGVDALPFDEGSFDVVAGVGPILLWGDREKAVREIYRVLRSGGVALIGGRYLGMPDWRKVPRETLRAAMAETGIPSIRVYDDMGQWVEIRKGFRQSDAAD
jgi:ubiquinone/menaquinone biosynthesis C-methylase UbiE